MATIAFYAQFIASAVGANGLTVTWDVERITRADGSRSALVTGGATNIVVGRRGLYGYFLAGADLLLYDYVATAITAGTADQKEISALWSQFDATAYAVVSNAGYGNSALATAIGAVPTAGEIDTQLSGTHGAGAWTAATGTGTGVYTDTVTDGSNPLDNVRVQLSTDVAGTNRIYEATTNALGVFTVYPDPGTYYCWVDHARVKFPQGFQVVVT